MKLELSSLDLYYLVKEFEVIVNSRIDKVFQKEDLFLFIFNKAGQKILLKSKPTLAFLSNLKEDYPTPPGFCSFLRKHLLGMKVKSISQINFERIIKIEFTGRETRNLYLELFAKGNIILSDENDIIIGALDAHKWKDRTVRGGVKYQMPPSQINTPIISKEEFSKTISDSEMDMIVKSFAVDFSLGGLYAQELCMLAKIDSNSKPKPVGYKELISLFSKKISPRVYEFKENKDKPDFEIVPFECLSLNEKFDSHTSFNSFSEAVDSRFSDKFEQEHVNKTQEKKNAALNKIKKIVSNQENTIIGLEKSAEENQLKGEKIYENYQLVKDILDVVVAQKTKMNWDDLIQKFNEQKEHKVMKKIERDGSITLELN